MLCHLFQIQNYQMDLFPIGRTKAKLGKIWSRYCGSHRGVFLLCVDPNLFCSLVVLSCKILFFISLFAILCLASYCKGTYNFYLFDIYDIFFVLLQSDIFYK